MRKATHKQWVSGGEAVSTSCNPLMQLWGFYHRAATKRLHNGYVGHALRKKHPLALRLGH